jgi:diguanylate cyclase (GGDEF)-like protein
MANLQEQTSWMGEIIGRKKDDAPFDAQLSASLVCDEAGEPILAMGSFIDITEQKRAEQDLRKANLMLATRLTEIEELQSQLRERAIRDPLTGLFNRRYLEENMGQTIARADRHNYPISLVMIDIDHFKVVNDTYGHKAGDQMLIALSNMLRSQIRKGDTICRYGGEEFVVMMPRAPWDIAAKRADQWRLAFQELCVPFDGAILNTTLSAGIATLSPDNNDIDDAMREADIALYRSKTEGRNRITVSDKFRG